MLLLQLKFLLIIFWGFGIIVVNTLQLFEDLLSHVKAWLVNDLDLIPIVIGWLALLLELLVGLHALLGLVKVDTQQRNELVQKDVSVGEEAD